LTDPPRPTPPASIIYSPLPPPPPPPNSPHIESTNDGVPRVPSTVNNVCFSPTICHTPSTVNKVPCVLLIAPTTSPHRDSPICFTLPSEEDVLGLEEYVLGFHITHFPPGLLSLECVGTVSPCTAANLGLHEDSWTNEIRAQLLDPAGIQDSLVHIVACPQVCGIFGDGTHVCAFTNADITPHCGLCNSGANLCMTNNPNLLMDVCPCAPFTILLATSDGGHSHTNVCHCRCLLPLPLLDGTTYYQTCFVNPYASEMFISPQAIIDSSAGSFDKWQMEGFLQGRPGVLSLYSPSGLLKMSIQLSQQDGLYYSSLDTFTVDTNPWSQYFPLIGSAFTDLPPDLT
jgi:hypothetical protein